MKGLPNQSEVKPFTVEDFTKEYQALCEKTGFRINVNPAFIARDDGSWSIVLQTSVSQMPKKA